MSLSSIVAKAKAHPIHTAVIAGGAVYVALGLRFVWKFSAPPRTPNLHNLGQLLKGVVLWPVLSSSTQTPGANGGSVITFR